MDLISKRDALDKVHKTIENLILRLPSIRGADGEDYCADLASLAAYNMAYEHIRREIQGIQAWHTEDPEESGKYLITWEVTRFGKTYRKLAIAEWEAPITNDEGDIVMESGAWILEDWLKDYDELSVVAWMPLPDAFKGEV